MIMMFSATSLSSNSGDIRETIKMPAVTMVAAWIKRRNGRGAFHRIGQPHMQRKLGRFAHGTNEQANGSITVTTDQSEARHRRRRQRIQPQKDLV
jgi:hypothetical protein